MQDECIDHGQRGNGKGYGTKHHCGRPAAFHRAIYCESRGISLSEIRGLVVRHACDNARCVNPKHLLIGTHSDNAIDSVAPSSRAFLLGKKKSMHFFTSGNGMTLSAANTLVPSCPPLIAGANPSTL